MDSSRKVLTRTSAACHFALATLALALGVGCSSTEDPPPLPRQLHEVQVAGTFPVHIGEDGSVTRICGAPPDGGPQPVANGLQFAVNLVTDTAGNRACSDDQDTSVHAGELVDNRPVRADGSPSTVDAARWSLELDCLNDEASKDGACVTKAATVVAQSVRYASYAPRCSKGATNAAQRVAIVMDHSGSTSGQIFPGDELAPYGTEQPEDQTILGPGFGTGVSDPFNARVSAAQRLITQLNPSDRVISYRFGTGPVTPACSGARSCADGEREGKHCDLDADCGASATEGSCRAAQSWLGSSEDPYTELTEPEVEARCFAASELGHADNISGLHLIAKLGGSGRAPLWAAIQHAYRFFRYRGGGGPGPAHIVVFTDGPDTCTPGEDFESRRLDSNQPEKAYCLKPCPDAVGWQELRQAMESDGFPVHVHVIQFQSLAYRAPEPRLQDLACLSGGTYQFIRSQDYPWDQVEAWQKMDAWKAPFHLAADRVRAALAGQWLVTFPVSESPSAGVPIGEQLGLSGRLVLSPSAFPTVGHAYYPNAAREPYQFGMGGADDDRLSLRVACGSFADCGGSNPCASQRCNLKGVCEAEPAKSYLPCGEDSVCCNSACVPTTACFDQQVCKPNWTAP